MLRGKKETHFTPTHCKTWSTANGANLSPSALSLKNDCNQPAPRNREKKQMKRTTHSTRLTDWITAEAKNRLERHVPFTGLSLACDHLTTTDRFQSQLNSQFFARDPEKGSTKACLSQRLNAAWLWRVDLYLHSGVPELRPNHWQDPVPV